MITIVNIGISFSIAYIACYLVKFLAIVVIARHPELSSKKVQYLTDMFI